MMMDPEREWKSDGVTDTGREPGQAPPVPSRRTWVVRCYSLSGAVGYSVSRCEERYIV
jgi:hypothetical protein